MVSFDSRGIVNKVRVLLLAQFPQKAIYFTAAQIMMLDMLTSCFRSWLMLQGQLLILLFLLLVYWTTGQFYQRAR